MLNDFKKNINALLTQYNKKNKDKFELIEDIDQWKKVVDSAVILDLQSHDIDLHQYVILVIEGIIDVAKKKKLKDKYISTFMHGHKLLSLYVEDNHEFLTPIDRSFDLNYYLLPQTANLCINKYADLIVSKTIDYIVNNETNRKQFESVLDLFDAIKDRLSGLASEEATRLWIYPYTEINWFQPYTLGVLNQFDKLGDKICNASDIVYQNRIVKMCNQRGYDVFAGWGYPDNAYVEKTYTLEAVKTSGEYPRPSKDDYQRIVKDMWLHCYMFFQNKLFNINVGDHRAIFIRSLCCCLIEGRFYDKDFFLNVVEDLRNEMKRRARELYQFARKGGKAGWFIDSDVDLFVKYESHLRTRRWEKYSTLIAFKMFDHLTVDVNQEMDSFKSMHNYLAKSHNVIFYNHDPLSAEEISAIMTFYQDYLMKRFALFTPDERKWGYKASLEFLLNIKDLTRVNEAYDVLKYHFEKRNTREENEQFYENNKWTLYFYSYSNKRLLLERLEKEPIDIVSYGGSKELYQNLIDLVECDAKYQDEQFRYRKLDIKDGETVVVEPGIDLDEINKKKEEVSNA